MYEIDDDVYCYPGTTVLKNRRNRAQLAFMAILADAAGHPLHLDRLEPEVFLRAMIRSFHGDEELLAEQLARLL